MSRPPPAAEDGLLYHALNRTNTRLAIFDDVDDHNAFARVLDEAVRRLDIRLLAYYLMPDHFHLVHWPEADGVLSRFLRRLTMTHTRRWHAHRHSPAPANFARVLRNAPHNVVKRPSRGR